MEIGLVGKHYRILKKIGSGSFGDIYEVEHTVSRIHYALKIQRRRPNKDSRLLLQKNLYEELAGTYGICSIYEFYQQEQRNMLVMERLAYSLEDLFQMCGKKLSEKSVLMIGEQLVSRIEYFHRKGYVHRDIKSNNFMVADDMKKLYIIDFGLAKPYKDLKTGQHIHHKGGKSLVGTARYASIASHNGYEQCRRDDLESLGYLLVYFSKGSLPWQGIKIKVKQDKYAKIGKLKKQIPVKELCEGMAQEFSLYLLYVKGLQFAEMPNYDYLRGLFTQKLKQYDTLEFDWQRLRQKTEGESQNIVKKSTKAEEEFHQEIFQ